MNIIFLQKYKWEVAGFVLLLALTGGIEWWLGRSPLGPDGMFGWWDGNIWGNENSQRVADVYSFSHIIHGILFYTGLWLIARRIPIRYRFLIAMVIEVTWELLENSPIIINRYREGTIAQGYTGDSILNSVSDVVMMAIGYAIAYSTKVWMSVAVVIVLELGCLLWIRDNLTLNVIMLIRPISVIREWQSEIKPTILP